MEARSLAPAVLRLRSGVAEVIQASPTDPIPRRLNLTPAQSPGNTGHSHRNRNWPT
jgi:hypothetical protein